MQVIGMVNALLEEWLEVSEIVADVEKQRRLPAHC